MIFVLLGSKQTGSENRVAEDREPPEVSNGRVFYLLVKFVIKTKSNHNSGHTPVTQHLQFFWALNIPVTQHSTVKIFSLAIRIRPPVMFFWSQTLTQKVVKRPYTTNNLRLIDTPFIEETVPGTWSVT